MIDDSHCDRIHSSLTAAHCFGNGYVRKQPEAWKEYCAEYWLKEHHEIMDRCTGRRDITEILLKTALNNIQSINQTQDYVLVVKGVRSTGSLLSEYLWQEYDSYGRTNHGHVSRVDKAFLLYTQYSDPNWEFENFLLLFRWVSTTLS